MSQRRVYAHAPAPPGRARHPSRLGRVAAHPLLSPLFPPPPPPPLARSPTPNTTQNDFCLCRLYSVVVVPGLVASAKPPSRLRCLQPVRVALAALSGSRAARASSTAASSTRPLCACRHNTRPPPPRVSALPPLPPRLRNLHPHIRPSAPPPEKAPPSHPLFHALRPPSLP